MKARLKCSVHDVWQHSGGSVPRWVFVATDENDNGELILVRRSGRQLIERGDWLIRDLDGEPMWMTNRDFKREYEIP
jgi:hypothetical protein